MSFRREVGLGLFWVTVSAIALKGVSMVRDMVLARWLLPDELGLVATATMAVSALATEWRGQGPIDLPGIRVERADGQLFFGANRPDAESDAEPDLAPDVRPDADETIDRRDGRGD